MPTESRTRKKIKLKNNITNQQPSCSNLLLRNKKRGSKSYWNENRYCCCNCWGSRFHFPLTNHHWPSFCSQQHTTRQLYCKDKQKLLTLHNNLEDDLPKPNKKFFKLIIPSWLLENPWLISPPTSTTCDVCWFSRRIISRK